MTYYYTGGGTPQITATSKLFLAMFLGGFPDGTTFVDITDGSYITDDDPYLRFGSASGGAKEVEIGLYNDYRIKFETTGITYWDGDSWEDLIGIFNPPIGYISMFSGSWTDNVTIPGWYKCDGNNGTVNLVGKFVRGGTSSGATGGSNNAIAVTHSHSHNHSVTGGSHYHNSPTPQNVGNNHTWGQDNVLTQRHYEPGNVAEGNEYSSRTSSKSHNHTVGNDSTSSGSSGTNANIPAYYTLIYIQRIS